MIDGDSIAAGWDMVKLLGCDEACTLLEVLELPDDERWVFISRSSPATTARRSPRCWPTWSRTSLGRRGGG